MALVNGRHYPQGFRTGVNAGALPQVTGEERLGEPHGVAMNRVGVDTRDIDPSALARWRARHWCNPR